MPDVDLRKLRYFVAVADALHFGRAAEALHIAQPVLTRQIRGLETELKVQLFARDRRGTTLTAAGEQLLADARPLLADAAALQRRVARAASGEDRFTVGFLPGMIVTPATQQLATRHPGLRVEVQRLDWDRQAEAVMSGEVDVGYLRRGYDNPRLQTCRLYDEPVDALLPADHRFAGKEAIMIGDLAGETVLPEPVGVPGWAGRQLPASPTTGPRIGSVEEKLEYVAAGNGVVLMPGPAAAYYTRPDVVHVRVRDLPPGPVVLCWRTPTAVITEYAAIARSLVP